MKGSDPWDDGGTPMWRARRARHEPEVIDVYRPGFRSWWRRSSPAKIFLYSLLFFASLPIMAIIGGIVVLLISDRASR